MDENDQNGRVVGREYGVAGRVQLEEIKAVRAAAHDEDYYYPPGATEPVLIEE